jgi:hypothetical protein
MEEVIEGLKVDSASIARESEAKLARHRAAAKATEDNLRTKIIALEVVKVSYTLVLA